MFTPAISSEESSQLVRFVASEAELRLDGPQIVVVVPRGGSAVAELFERLDFSVESTPEAYRLRGVDAFDLLHFLLESPEGSVLRNSELGRRLTRYSQTLPVAPADAEGTILVQQIDERAVVPFKARASDSGYDLTLIEERKRFGSVRLYGTGLIVQPPEGYYFDVVARSSIIKTGYMLANNVGIIDRAYRGELLVPVIKVDAAAPDLSLPARLAQLIPRPIVHFPVELTASLSQSSRGAGGFGSTGQ